MGGGIFALRRPRPYSRHCGEGDATHALPTIICDHMGINGNGEWEDHDAALVREGTRVARHLPYQARNGQSRQLIGM